VAKRDHGRPVHGRRDEAVHYESLAAEFTYEAWVREFPNPELKHQCGTLAAYLTSSLALSTRLELVSILIGFFTRLDLMML
jgi:hypothetical protein